MATLSKHGSEVARFDYLRFSLSFRSDGSILRNVGDGWKLAKLKDGVEFDAFLANCRVREEKRTREFKDYRAAVISEFPLSIREVYLTLADLLDGDIDGLKRTWSASKKESGVAL